MTGGYQRAWVTWDCDSVVDLLNFITEDVPVLKSRAPWQPYTEYGLRTAELAAYDLFPDGPESNPGLAGRWNRYVGHTMVILLGVGQWIDAPPEAPGVRDSAGLMPVVRLPDGVIILPMLERVLAEPPGSPHRGAILIEAVTEERAALERWLTSGQPRPEADQVRWRTPLDHRPQ